MCDAMHVRPAIPGDIPAMMRMKRALAALDGHADVFRASEYQWARDIFGAEPRFSALIAQHEHATVGMAIYSQKHITGWTGPTIYLQDLFVKEGYRRQGVAKALLQKVAASLAGERLGQIELNVRADNPARDFYQRMGFEHISICMTYVIGGPALAQLASVAGDLVGII